MKHLLYRKCFYIVAWKCHVLLLFKQYLESLINSGPLCIHRGVCSDMNTPSMIYTFSNSISDIKFVNPVKIRALHVPDTVILESLNEPRSLYLDCDYELNPKEKGFVMKWYFNDQLVYQWIPDRQPLALNTFRNVIDVNTTVNRGILIR